LAPWIHREQKIESNTVTKDKQCESNLITIRKRNDVFTEAFHRDNIGALFFHRRVPANSKLEDTVGRPALQVLDGLLFL
jgi:hypothetical protein